MKDDDEDDDDGLQTEEAFVETDFVPGALFNVPVHSSFSLSLTLRCSRDVYASFCPEAMVL